MNFNTFNVTVSKQDPKRSRTLVDAEAFRLYVILVSGVALTDYFDSVFYVIMAVLFGGGMSMLATILAHAWVWLSDKREARRARREADREMKEFENFADLDAWMKNEKVDE